MSILGGGAEKLLSTMPDSVIQCTSSNNGTPRSSAAWLARKRMIVHSDLNVSVGTFRLSQPILFSHRYLLLVGKINFLKNF